MEGSRCCSAVQGRAAERTGALVACRATGSDLGLAESKEDVTSRSSSLHGSVVARAQASAAVEQGASATPAGEADTTMCILSGDVISDPEKAAQESQEKIIKQLKVAQLVFPALALSRLIDSLPGLLNEDGNTYSEIVTIVSAVDPLLVGIFAYGTANGLQVILDKEKRHEESLEAMRQKAMDSLVNFFERANLVVFGVVLATVSRLFLEGAAQSDQWADIEGKLLEYGNQLLEMAEIAAGLIESTHGG